MSSDVPDAATTLVTVVVDILAPHLRREPSADHRQGVVVVLREHAERDAVLQRQRARLERELRDVVDRFGDSPDLQAVVIGVCSRISHELHRCTRDLADRRWGEARVDEIRRERQAWLNR